MFEQIKQGNPGEELFSLIPEFKVVELPSSSQRRIRRRFDMDNTDAAIKANRLVNRHKVAMVAVMCQGQIEDAVSLMIERNPRYNAAQNLNALALASAEYLYQTMVDDSDSFWRR